MFFYILLLENRYTTTNPYAIFDKIRHITKWFFPVSAGKEGKNICLKRGNQAAEIDVLAVLIC